LSFTEFPVPTPTSYPAGITAGPDGNLWFTEGGGNQIGQITPDGRVTEFPVPTPSSFPYGIMAGPDGNLWFTEFGANQVGRFVNDGLAPHGRSDAIPKGQLAITRAHDAPAVAQTTVDATTRPSSPLPHPPVTGAGAGLGSRTEAKEVSVAKARHAGDAVFEGWGHPVVDGLALNSLPEKL
jgi:hypothetical protein